MYSFTEEEFEELKENRWYKKTNGAWNQSGVNNPKNVGYVIEHITECNPENYKEWEDYFFEKVTNKEKIKGFSTIFRNAIFSDAELMKFFDYSSLDEKEFCKMVECRLIYETWLGYFAEQEACRTFLGLLEKDGYHTTTRHMSPCDDNKYAVDFLLYDDETLVCGLQIKPHTYYKSDLPIVKDTIKTNEKKNTMFVEKYRVPVEYLYYRRMPSHEYRLIKNGAVERTEKLLYDNAYPF